uniref:centrosomal protein of 126 kDa n=1 Tax=Euleptes europaea TaxID=460621 RepID=UPI002540F1BF|nr:centrosomal protein of 126 kDa [Euleptes europaea]
MELGGGGGGSNVSYYSGYARAAAAEAKAAAAPCWRRSPSDGALARGGGRRAWSAFAPSTNLRIFLERDLSKERHELLKDQRLFHNQARKHYVETNKRRRALEEKRKEEEEKEQKFREQILLQRKLKHQEATEKFQRGHLPYAQRKRVQRKVEPKLDEAFEKIQITGLPLSVYRGDGRTTDTTKHDPFQWKQNIAKSCGDKIMEELRNVEELQQQLHKKHFSNLQSFQEEVNEIAISESIGSTDSLEAGEQTESFATPSEASSPSAQLDSTLHNSQESQAKNKSLSDCANVTFSKNQNVNNWLISLNTSNIQRNSPFHDILIKYNARTPEEQACDPDQKPSLPSTSEQKEPERCTSADNLAFMQNKRGEKCSQLKNPSSGTASTEDTLATDNKAWAILDPSPVALVQEKHPEVLRNNQTSLAQPPNPTAATPVVFPTGQCSTATYNNDFSVNCWQKGKDAHTARCTEDIDCAEMENCSNRINSEAPLLEETDKSSLDQQNDSMICGDSAANLSDHDHQRNDNDKRKGVKLPKSILKKESKYEPSNSFKALVVNRGIRFGNQPVCAIKDSIELAKIKGKDADTQRNCKKLRWFDEINRVQGTNDDEKCSEQNVTEIPRVSSQSSGFPIKATTSRTNLRSIPSCVFNSTFLENGQDSSQTSTKLAISGGSERNNGTLNPFESTGYHIAKQAWMAPKVDEIKPLLYAVDLKNPRSNPRKGRAKMIKRPKSAKVPSTFTPKNRKGTIIRPQSASEATNVMKAQGKIMLPHPPYKSVPGKGTDQNSSSLSNEGQDSNGDATEGPPPQNVPCYSHVGPGRPSEPPPTIVTYDPLMKASLMANAVQSVAQHNNAIQGSPTCSENELCVDHTPTDEEIKVLWQGVHTGLTQKDGAAGDSKHCPIHHNNSSHGDSQPARTSVPHITIDGGSLTNNVKPGLRVNGFFSSQPSTAVARRKQTNDHIENKRKALLEQRRQMAASAGWKPSYLGQNSVQAVKLGPFQSSSEPVYTMGGIGHSDEVTDSTSQFLLAEQLVSTAATEGEILTYLDTAPQHKPTVVLNRPLRPGMSSLSLEEHKVLHSLDRLNQRLQTVQETIHKNPSSTSILQTISTLGTSPSSVDAMPSIQRCKSILADARTLTQKRY